MKKIHPLKILSSLIVKFSVQAENFYFQEKFLNCYLREIISFSKKIDIRDWGQSTQRLMLAYCTVQKCVFLYSS